MGLLIPYLPLPVVLILPLVRDLVRAKYPIGVVIVHDTWQFPLILNWEENTSREFRWFAWCVRLDFSLTSVGATNSPWDDPLQVVPSRVRLRVSRDVPKGRWNQIWWFSGNQSLGFSGNLTVGCRKSRREPGHSKESQLLWTGPFLESIWLIVCEMIFLKRYILGKIFFFKYLLNFDIKELQTCWADAPGLLRCLKLWFPCKSRTTWFEPGQNITFCGFWK